MFLKIRPSQVLSLYQCVANEFSTFRPAAVALRGVDDRRRSSRKRYFSSNRSIILESQFGPATIPNANLPQYLWNDISKWGDKPMVVSRVFMSYLRVPKGRRRIYF